MLYVCDCINNREQVFRKDGAYVKEFAVEPRTAANGSVWDIVLSRDPAQRWIFLADGRNNQVVTLDRDTGTVVTREDRRNDYGEKRMVTFGLFRGAVVVLVHVERDDDIHIISLRRAERYEVRYYFETIKAHFG